MAKKIAEKKQPFADRAGLIGKHKRGKNQLADSQQIASK